MDVFLPSEIGRLVYGYLSEHCGQNLADEFFQSSESMKECRAVRNRYARNFHTRVQDLTLEAILDQYSKLCSLIFRTADGEEHVYANVLTLLEKILAKRVEKSSSQAPSGPAHVLKDVQNLPVDRNTVEHAASRSNGAGNLENKICNAVERADANEKCKTIKKISRAKQKLAAMITRSSRSTYAFGDFKSQPVRSCSRFEKKTYADEIASVTDTSVRLTGAKPEVPAANISSPCRKSAGSIFEPSSNFVRETTNDNILTETNVRLTESLRADIADQEAEISYSPLDSNTNDANGVVDVTTVYRNSPTLGNFLEKTSPAVTNPMHPVPHSSSNAESDAVDIRAKRTLDLSPPLYCSDVSSSSFSSAILLTPSVTLKATGSRVIPIAKETADDSSKHFDVEKEPGEISSSESSASDLNEQSPISRNDQVTNTNENETVLHPSSRNGEPLKNLECVADEKSIDQQREVPEKMVSEECQSIFDNLCKNFKRRSPFSSPAKSNRLLSRDALSPFSKMFVTPTKPHFFRKPNFNVPTNANTASTSSSSIPNGASIFSPVLNSNPKPIKLSNIQSTNFKRVADRVSDEEKKSTIAKKQKIDPETKSSPGHLRSELLGRIKMQKTNSVGEASLKRINCSKTNEIFLKNKKHVNSSPPSDSKTISTSSRNKDDERDIVPGKFNEVTSKLIGSEAKGTGTSNKEKEPDIAVVDGTNFASAHEKSGSRNSLSVYVKDIDEFALLDFSSAFIIYHRDSAC